MDSKPLVKSYVWFEDKCFLVSTINRNDSSELGGTYAETIVWEYDCEKRITGDIIFMDTDITGYIDTHMAIVASLYASGKCCINNVDE